jgi:dihydrofolate reductase
VSQPSGIEGYAIISADGMIADAARRMPLALTIEADQAFFHAGLDRAAAVAHGRHSHEGDPGAARRRRLIVTGSVSGYAPSPTYPNAMLWNPAGASLAAAWTALGAGDGTLAVIGGADVFELFWNAGYDAFHLTRVASARLPGGRPVFRTLAPGRTPEDVLESHGLNPSETRLLDAAAGVTLVTWRPAPSEPKPAQEQVEDRRGGGGEGSP